MKRIKCAKDVFDLISIATKQCNEEKCRVGVVFADTSYVELLKISPIELFLPDSTYSNGVIRARIGRESDYSIIDFFAMDIPRMCGKRYDYILMDSQIGEEGKRVLGACTVKYFGFHLGKNGPKEKRLKDKRKNIIQEFTLAEEWPLLI